MALSCQRRQKKKTKKFLFHFSNNNIYIKKWTNNKWPSLISTTILLSYLIMRTFIVETDDNGIGVGNNCRVSSDKRSVLFRKWDANFLFIN